MDRGLNRGHTAAVFSFWVALLFIISTTACSGGGSSGSAPNSSTSTSSSSSTSSSTGTNTSISTSSCPFTASDFTPPTGKPSSGTGGPFSEYLLTATSPDGLTWTRTKKILSYQADVPSSTVDGNGCLWVYYITNEGTTPSTQNLMVVALSADDGNSWVYKNVNISRTGTGGPNNLGSPPADPTIARLSNGTWRLYFTWSSDGTPVPATHYAEGTDGINFTEKGTVFSQSANGIPGINDPSAILIGSTWYFWAGGNIRDPNGNWYATDATNNGTSFTQVNGGFGSGTTGDFAIQVGGLYQIVANEIQTGSTYRIYTFDKNMGGTSQHINSVYSTDNGATWTADAGARLTLDTSGGTLEKNQVHDPAVTQLKNGGYFMVYSTDMP